MTQTSFGLKICVSAVQSVETDFTGVGFGFIMVVFREIENQAAYIMASHNLSHVKIDDLDVIGYSVAGEETVVAVPQLDVCFDIGGHIACGLFKRRGENRPIRLDLRHSE